MRTALLLNADFIPFDVISWKRAITMIITDNRDGAYSVKNYDHIIMDSKGRKYELPAVVVLKKFIDVVKRKAPYTRINVYARDRFICQYCGDKFNVRDLTIDHIIPRSKWKELGGKRDCSSFENTVACCSACNRYKNDRPLGEARYPFSVRESRLLKLAGEPMRLTKIPRSINREQAFVNKLLVMNIPDEWKPYIESVPYA